MRKQRRCIKKGVSDDPCEEEKKGAIPSSKFGFYTRCEKKEILSKLLWIGNQFELEVQSNILSF